MFEWNDVQVCCHDHLYAPDLEHRGLTCNLRERRDQNFKLAHDPLGSPSVCSHGSLWALDITDHLRNVGSDIMGHEKSHPEPSEWNSNSGLRNSAYFNFLIVFKASAVFLQVSLHSEFKRCNVAPDLHLQVENESTCNIL